MTAELRQPKIIYRVLYYCAAPHANILAVSKNEGITITHFFSPEQNHRSNMSIMFLVIFIDAIQPPDEAICKQMNIYQCGL